MHFTPIEKCMHMRWIIVKNNNFQLVNYDVECQVSVDFFSPLASAAWCSFHEMFFLIVQLQLMWEASTQQVRGRISDDGSADPVGLPSFINPSSLNYIAIVCASNWFLHSSMLNLICWFDKYFINFSYIVVPGISSAFIRWGNNAQVFSLFSSKWTISPCDASHRNSIIFEIWMFYPCFTYPRSFP